MNKKLLVLAGIMSVSVSYTHLLRPSGLIVLVGQESRVHLSKAEYADPDGGISALDRR